jgi:hypothetical protein
MLAFLEGLFIGMRIVCFITFWFVAVNFIFIGVEKTLVWLAPTIRYFNKLIF